MKLYARTPSGIAFGITVWPTGKIRTSIDTTRIASVEVKLPNGCDQVVSYTVEPLPSDIDGGRLIWAAPQDLYADEGTALSEQKLYEAIKQLRQDAIQYMNEGPLGKNWP